MAGSVFQQPDSSFLRRGVVFGRALLIVGLAGMFAVAAPVARAQQICGDGTTFSVNLPSISGGASDSVELPRGCRIYALLVSGYSRNDKLDEFTFYNLAKFVAENDGYVHWAWWNNVLKPYLEGPLHADETFRMSVPPHTVFGQTPGGLVGVHAAGFVPASHILGAVPKAVPEDDHQFQADAKKVLAAIRAENPTAIIVVAGHSMGGNAVARLGSSTPVDIDLLAPIDPVGNRSSPVGRPTVLDPRADATFNWTRWRATREFAGFRVRDCVRNALGLCQNFGTLLNPQYRCATVGPLLSAPPELNAGRLLCNSPSIDSGRPLVFGGRIKRLYHRWQNETLFPFDYGENYFFAHWAPRNAGGATTAINYQAPVGLCASVIQADPRDPTRLCNPTDGHGELIGFRFPTPGQPNPPGPNLPVAPLALQAPSSWPQFFANQSSSEKQTRATTRRSFLIQMADTSPWPYRPMQPNLDLVADDMVAIVKQLLNGQPAPATPTTAATPTPGPNVHGWNNDDVTVNLTATAGSGRTVTAIEYSLAGEQTAGSMVHQGDTVDVSVSAEGDTTLTYFARDNVGSVETPRQLVIRLDKTPPSVLASASPGPNASGWNNTAVTVSFSATDALSGVDTVDPPMTLMAEGAAQEAAGTATDLAGNVAVAVATISIDRTPPVLAGLPDLTCLLWPPSGKLVQVASVTSFDELSGLAPGSLSVTGTSSEPDAGLGGAKPGDIVIAADGTVLVRAERTGGGTGRTYTVSASVRDAAGNMATATGSCIVPHDRRR